METTMKLLKTRVQSRLALHKQFASLGKLVWEVRPDSHSVKIGIKATSFPSELVNPVPSLTEQWMVGAVGRVAGPFRQRPELPAEASVLCQTSQKTL